ncbi:MAG: glycoside hydrolase family 15 protein, partial [Bacteroidota bacterium]
YWPETNVLVTRFLAKGGVVEITDFMPAPTKQGSHHSHLVRWVKCIRGKLKLHLHCQPALNYGQDKAEITVEGNQVIFGHAQQGLRLWSSVPLEIVDEGAEGEFWVTEGESLYFSMGLANSAQETQIQDQSMVEDAFHQTVGFWRQWLKKCTYQGRWQDMIYRSALTLKLLTFAPTGAIVAAPTTSLPEEMGGSRNWDYRYTWIRDAAFTIYAFMRIGFTEEAAAFMAWVEARILDLDEDEPLQIMYGIQGQKKLDEHTLTHLGGYRGSLPVRVGNGAFQQLQLDIYGELMDSVYLYNKYGAPISYSFWTKLRGLVNWVCDHWQEKDKGIWEVRGGRQHYVYSKLMCWVCVDRAIRLADKRSFPADREKWLRVRDQIFEEIMDKGWSQSRQTVVQAYGSDALDAANLIMPLVLFIGPNDPKMVATLEATLQPLSQGGLMANDLVYRYDVKNSPDGLEGEEGTFNICTFWLVEALTRLGKTQPGYQGKARLMFEHMLSYANHLGLYAEETGPCGEALGNFPQAFTHLALISAAFNLDRNLS